MNIYIWHDVLCDYSCGMAVAIAPDLEAAIAEFERPSVRSNLEAIDPIVIPCDTTKRYSTFVWGGG